MKVSVIIPVYNAEKFLSVCLESLLIQTLQDFEVIVADDCSTDSSLDIAESYLERFGERLKIITLPGNTGSGAVPRNVGLEYAQGKYIFFADNDDLLIDTALETLYEAAEESQAEVLYMEKFFTCDEEPVPKNLTPAAWCHNDSIVDEFTFETNDLSRRLEKFLSSKYCWAPWSKFFRRDFLVDNEIIFPQMTIADDVVQTFEIICLAKKILRVPPPLYVHRENNSSLFKRPRTPEQQIIFRTNPLIIGLDCLDNFMREVDYFQKNPAVRLQVLNFFMLLQIDNMADELKSLEPEKVYEIFLREFSKADSTQPALISYLLLMTNLYRNELRALT
ncbi:MAG: glycosyltransferase [Selenomonadaceae bacterium]|nr:glycosyltransferase [Selenomonadaceae bacterium]